MGLRKCNLAALFICVTTIMTGQNIITITEKDRDGNYLKEDGCGYKNNKIVDINSVLKIELNRDTIIRDIGKIYEIRLPDNIAKTLTTLTKAIENRNEILSELKMAVDRYDYELFKSNKSDYEEFVKSLQAKSQTLIDILEKDDRIEHLYITKYGDEDVYEGVYKAADDIIHELKVEIEEFTKENGVYFQFGCWIHTKNETLPIHLLGFDNIAPQEPYEVERWQFMPTEQQIKELQMLQKLSKENSDNGQNILKIVAKKQLDVLKAFGYTELNKLLNDVKKEIAKMQSTGGSSFDAKFKSVIKAIGNLESEIDSFKTELDKRMKYYNNMYSIKDFQLSGFLTNAKNDIKFITEADGKILMDNIGQIFKDIQTLSQDVTIAAGDIKPLFEKLQIEYAKNFNSIKASAETTFENILLGTKLDIAALEFSEDVYKLALSDIPGETELDLINTGVRGEGDRLAFKLTVASKDKNDVHIFDTKEIYMFKVLPHIETSVGAIFADPFVKT